MGYLPVRKAALLGVQTAAAAMCWVSLTPSFARPSMLGVLKRKVPHFYYKFMAYLLLVLILLSILPSNLQKSQLERFCVLCIFLRYLDSLEMRFPWVYVLLLITKKKKKWKDVAGEARYLRHVPHQNPMQHREQESVHNTASKKIIG